MGAARGDFFGVEGGDERGMERAEEGRVDVPAVEAGVVEVEVGGDGGFVEGAVVRVLEGEVLEAFVGGDVAVADNLDFGLGWDGFEVGMEDGALGVDGLAVAVGCGGWVEPAGEGCLSLGGEALLFLDADDVVAVQSVSEALEVLVAQVVKVDTLDFCS